MLNEEEKIKRRLVTKKKNKSCKLQKNLTGLCSNIEEEYNYLFKNLAKRKDIFNSKNKKNQLSYPTKETFEEIKCNTITFDTNTTSKNTNHNNILNQNFFSPSNQFLDNNLIYENDKLIYELKPLYNNIHSINTCFSDNSLNHKNENLSNLPLKQLYNISSGITSNKSTNCPSANNINKKINYFNIENTLNNNNIIDINNTREFNLSRRLLSSNSSKNKLIRDLVGSSSYQHCCTKEVLKIEKNESEKNFKNNIKLLENWISEIKDFDKKKNDKIESKKNKTNKINKRINSYKRKIRSTSQKNRKIIEYQEKESKEYDKNIKKYNWNKKLNKNQIENINKIKLEINDLPSKIEKLNLETLELQQQFPLEQLEIDEMNKKIVQLNNEITKINKEKEALTKDITYYKKQIKNNKVKINEQFNKISNFMLSVNDIVENIREEEKKEKNKK